MDIEPKVSSLTCIVIEPKVTWNFILDLETLLNKTSFFQKIKISEPYLTSLANGYDSGAFTLIVGDYYWILSNVFIQIHGSTLRITSRSDHVCIWLLLCSIS